MKPISVLGMFLIFSAVPLSGVAHAASSTVCTQCLSIRVGPPVVEQGPTGTIADGPFNEVGLSNGQFRGFSDNQNSYEITGTSALSMTGAATEVFPMGGASWDTCGNWINTTLFNGSTLEGFIHTEYACDYADNNQTYKSMSYATSSDNGMTWTMAGQIITGQDAPTTGEVAGEGDCTMVTPNDGYLYAYCLRDADWTTIVARAPINSPTPGNWYKYYDSSWSQPGLGGNATALKDQTGDSFYSVDSALWTGPNNVALIGLDMNLPVSGLKFSVSSDEINFSSVTEPVLILEANNWSRPAVTELIAYPAFVSPFDGTNSIENNQFELTYTYLEPQGTFSTRYLVFRPVTVIVHSAAVTPQVGVALSRWENTSLQDNWTTTAAVPENGYVNNSVLGYILTNSIAGTTKMADCAGTLNGHPDHWLSPNSCPTGYTYLRNAGYLFNQSQPNTVALYTCYDPSVEQHWVSRSSGCDNDGSINQGLLGYIWFVFGEVLGNDTSVSLQDAVAVAQYAVGLPVSINVPAAQVDGTSALTLNDASLIAQRAIGSISQFPAESS